MRLGGQLHAPAGLTPGITRYPLYRRLGRPQGRSGRVLKISPPQGFDPMRIDGNPAGIQNSYLSNRYASIERYLENKERGRSHVLACGSCLSLIYERNEMCLIAFCSVPSTRHVVRDS
jgi:hypothetical protein